MIGKNVLELSPDALKHSIADAAGIVSHTSGGQMMPADLRINAIPREVKDKIIETLNAGAENVA